MCLILHMGPTEWIYYWFHRALHHHYLYSRYHSHHHASFVTEPVSGEEICMEFQVQWWAWTCSQFNEEVVLVSNVAKKYWVVICALKCRFGTSFRRAFHVHSHICNSPLRNVGFGRSVDGNVLFLLALLRLYERNWALQFWVCSNLGVSSVSASQIPDLYSHVSNFISSVLRYYSYFLTQYDSWSGARSLVYNTFHVR